MKHFRSFFLGVILTLALTFALQASAGVASFKTAFIADMNAQFDAATKQRIANAFVSAYQAEWNARVAAGTADTLANRGQFVADKTVDTYIKGVVQQAETDALRQALPAPTPLP